MTRSTTSRGWRKCITGRDHALVSSIDGVTMAFALGPAIGEMDRSKRLSILAGALAPELRSLAFCRQVHGSIVHRVTALSGQVVRVGDGDGLVTTTAGLGILIWTADCVPVLLAGPGIVAAVHSGWRGCAADVLGAAVEEIERSGGPGAQQLRAFFGPAICGRCYQVGAEVVRALARFDLDEARWRDGDRVDLRGFLSARLESLGLPPDRIETVGACTMESPVLASYRRDGDSAGRQWAMVFLNS